MDRASLIEFCYLASGLLLPAFYVPQIVKLWHDQTGLASYSLSKSLAHLLLRLPTMAFALVVVQHSFMTFVLVLDLLGRAVEFLAALRALRRQGVSSSEIGARLNPAHSMAAPLTAESNETDEGDDPAIPEGVA